MTKCEPVDKKPYIVYTTESGILYSDDPNADIPGGGGGTYSIACYAMVEGVAEPTTSFIYKTKVQIEGDVQYHVPDGEPVTTASAGDFLITTDDVSISAVISEFSNSAFAYPTGTTPVPLSGGGGQVGAFIMPSHDVFVLKE